MVSQLIGATEQRNVEVEEELSLALEETLEEDDLEDLPAPAKPLKDKNHVVAKRNPKRANVIHEESRSKGIRRVPAKYLQ